jgi:hypothetical protein
MDKQADWLLEQIQKEFPDEIAAGWTVSDVDAPFHARVLALSKKHTFSIVALPLHPLIALERRFPGIWHCLHNSRHVMWIIIKDAAATYGVIQQLERALGDIGLPQVKVTAIARKKKSGPGFEPLDMHAVISQEDHDVLLSKQSEEAKRDCMKRGSMNGNEMQLVLGAFEFISERLKEGVLPKNKLRLEKWIDAMKRSLVSFNAGAAVALADMWSTNRSAEMGDHFRDWADVVCDEMGPKVGLPYNGRDYLAILPIHWLCEPDHLQASSSMLWETTGTAPGSGTDATTEMVSF